MITYTHPLTDNLPIKTLVVGRLQTNNITLSNSYALSLVYCMTVPIKLCPRTHTHVYIHTHVHTTLVMHTYTVRYTMVFIFFGFSFAVHLLALTLLAPLMWKFKASVNHNAELLWLIVLPVLILVHAVLPGLLCKFFFVVLAVYILRNRLL